MSSESESSIDELVAQLKTVEIEEKGDYYTFHQCLSEPQRKVMDEIVHLFKEGKFKNIIFLTGAGISVSAGIPDFRSPGTGLYDNLQVYDLPYPEAVFELDYFEENPKPFYDLAKELWPGLYSPTLSHHFIRTIHEKGLLLRNFTQNIDGLERLAGVPASKLVEAHGTFSSASCIKCRSSHPMEHVKSSMAMEEIPKCIKPSCGHLVKPDIVFFGENLPKRFHNSLSDLSECDLLIVMGTSLKVHPFCQLIDHVPSTCHRILINRDLVGNDPTFLRPFHFGHGSKDLFLQGDCDTMIQRLACALELEDDLELYKENVSEQHKLEQ